MLSSAQPAPERLRAKAENEVPFKTSFQPRDATGNLTGADVKYPLAMVPGAGRTAKLTFSAECTADKCDLQCNGGACTQD